MSLGGGPRQIKCSKCHQLFIQRKQDEFFCDNCKRPIPQAAPAAPAPQPPRPAGGFQPGGFRSPQPGGGGLPAGYLQSGYFDEQDNLRVELLLDEADAVARALGSSQRLASTQLRRFFNKVRLIEQHLDSREFGAVRAEIADLVPHAVDAVGREVAPDVFKQFVERNARLALKDEASFRKGFVPHFEAVVCYFKYNETDRNRNFRR